MPGLIYQIKNTGQKIAIKIKFKLIYKHELTRVL